MKKSILSVCILSFFFTGCSNEQGGYSVHSIIGADDRVPTSDYSNLIGVFQVNGENICTAFISGENEITTAAHCLVQEIADYTFQLPNGKKYPVNSMIYLNGSADIAVLGSPVGLNYIQSDNFYSNRELSLISFSSDFGGLIKSKNGSAVVEGNFLLHTFDSLPESSGSPLLQNGNVVGLHIGTKAADFVNVALYLQNENTANIFDLGHDFEPEFKIKKKIGGSIGNAIGQVTNPIRDTVTAPIANAVENLTAGSRNLIVNRMAQAVANDPNVRKESAGWTLKSCNRVGSGVIGTAALIYQAPVCSLIGAGVGSVACAAFIAGSTALITDTTCTQLCNDRHLRDPECR